MLDQYERKELENHYKEHMKLREEYDFEDDDVESLSGAHRKAGADSSGHTYQELRTWKDRGV